MHTSPVDLLLALRYLSFCFYDLMHRKSLWTGLRCRAAVLGGDRGRGGDHGPCLLGPRVRLSFTGPSAALPQAPSRHIQVLKHTWLIAARRR